VFKIKQLATECSDSPPNPAVDHCGYRLGTTAKLIAVGLLESGRPGCGPQDLTTAKTVAKIGVVNNTAGRKKERGTPIHRS
jgi:hypothetical protein